MVELHSRAANQIMDWELDLLPGHTDTESLREWVEATATSKGDMGFLESRSGESKFFNQLAAQSLQLLLDKVH